LTAHKEVIKIGERARFGKIIMSKRSLFNTIKRLEKKNVKPLDDLDLQVLCKAKIDIFDIYRKDEYNKTKF